MDGQRPVDASISYIAVAIHKHDPTTVGTGVLTCLISDLLGHPSLDPVAPS